MAKRSPRIGDVVIDGSGTSTKISRFPLYQVGAPNFFDVTDDQGTEHQISNWNGTTWHSANSGAVLPAAQGDAPRPAAIKAPRLVDVAKVGVDKKQKRLRVDRDHALLEETERLASGAADALRAHVATQADAPLARSVSPDLGNDESHATSSNPRRRGRQPGAKSLDEGHGARGDLDSPPLAGSLPASSAISDGLAVGGPAGETRRAGYRTEPLSLSPIPVKRGERRRKVRTGNEGSSPSPSSTSSFAAQNRAHFAGAAAEEHHVVAPKATHRQDVVLSAHVAALHAQLDRARERVGQSRTDDREAEYHRCIRAVDAADPGFYLGRLSPIAPRPRYVLPDIDYAGISSRMTFSESVLAPIEEEEEVSPATCRVCGCTDDDCSGCVKKTGQSCYWVEPDLCSACAPENAEVQK